MQPSFYELPPCRADIPVCRLGRFSSRPLDGRTRMSGQPAGWKACPTFEFMVPMHAQERKKASHEPQPQTAQIFVPRGTKICTPGFMVGEQVRKEQGAFHEPAAQGNADFPVGNRGPVGKPALRARGVAQAASLLCRRLPTCEGDRGEVGGEAGRGGVCGPPGWPTGSRRYSAGCYSRTQSR